MRPAAEAEHQIILYYNSAYEYQMIIHRWPSSFSSLLCHWQVGLICHRRKAQRSDVVQEIQQQLKFQKYSMKMHQERFGHKVEILEPKQNTQASCRRWSVLSHCTDLDIVLVCLTSYETDLFFPASLLDFQHTAMIIHHSGVLQCYNLHLEPWWTQI